MINRYIVIGLFLCLSFNLEALSQETATNKYFQIGDTVPDFEFDLENYPIKKAKLSDFKGKLVILDFWATFCTNCIQAFPKMERYQKQFEEKLQVLLVNPYQNTDQIKKDEKRIRGVRPNIGFSSLPTTNGDLSWKKRFEINSAGRQVWIDGNRRVIAITLGFTVTENNIQKAIRGEKLDMINKKVTSEIKYSELKERGIVKQSHTQIVPLKYTAFGAYDPAFKDNGSVPIKVDSILNKKEVFLSNASITDLYRQAVCYQKQDSSRGVMLPVIIETARPDDFSRPSDEKLLEEYLNRNCFMYQTGLINVTDNELGYSMLDDLNQFFGKLYNIEGSVEKRKINTLVLKIADSTQLSKFVSNKVSGRLLNYYGLADSLTNLRLPRFFINETNFNRKVDIKLEGDLKDPENVRKQLNKYGLDLVEEMRDTEVIVIKDKVKNL